MLKHPEAMSDSDDIYSRLIEDIASGHLPGGTRLKISDLASRYESSTNPVREALRVLQGEGYVEFEPNKGAMVCQLDFNTVRDTYEILRIFEPYLVEWFAEYSEEKNIDELEKIQNELENITDPARDNVTDIDHRFHNYIADFHYNKRAVSLWKGQRTALRVFAARLPIGRSRYKAICQEHRMLIEAFRNHDANKASEVIRTHIEHAGQHLYEQIRMRDQR
ncbi:GntR family transcriptional regulator [Rhizobium hainanense]|uniref:DNA-binding transcriptional regulator, GntR family n=1 Tax=Rhizobium hainanense TaxID=52131 RepID=A0A1C3W9T2_9HYPH|nr:GntR family transcriptional regulator [Rhizobium hainanense]SCB36578.1 DNA-binding transcriptional regulator, GntR family [Rhizobium hainanense]